MLSGRFARYRSAATLLLIVGLQCGLAGIGSGEEPGSPTTSSPVDFLRDVRPTLEKRCFSCHGPDRQESDLRLDRRADALRGGENGVAIVPGKSAESPLVERISGVDPDVRMPPKGELLPQASVALIRAWIDQGAAWPTEPAVEAGDHWSLKPLVRPPVPTVNEAGPPPGAIDAFIRARLERSGLRPSAEADRLALLRRVTFDLTGLPPHAGRRGRIPRRHVADGLRAGCRSPAGQPPLWRALGAALDGRRPLCRNARQRQDRPRPNAWPYRDYLIRSFNEDKPYARFVQEQVAGDALYRRRSAGDRCTGIPGGGAVGRKLADGHRRRHGRQEISPRCSTATTWSAPRCRRSASTTVHCARCHDHKFDPISQADYYSLQAVFAGVDRAERPFDADPAVHARGGRWPSGKARSNDHLPSGEIAR